MTTLLEEDLLSRLSPAQLKQFDKLTPAQRKLLAATNRTVERGLREQLNETRKALRNLVNDVENYAGEKFVCGDDSPEAERAASKVHKRLAEARRLLTLNS